MDEARLDFDAIVIGGGPAGSAIGTFLARDGHKVLILERDIHPRDHVGESLVPSTNLVFRDMGVLDKIRDAGFIPKPGSAWNLGQHRRGHLVRPDRQVLPDEGRHRILRLGGRFRHTVRE
jgi:2-polyprenyl-6-methoxyphenol hydroxylase-like FAD-dependent oxidoreductase